MTGSLTYLWLEAKRQWRNREILIFRLGLPTAIYLILNAANGDTPPTSPGGRMVAIAALAAVISGLAAGPTLGEERANGWLRQLRTTPLRPSAAVAAKIVVAMSFALPAIALVAAVAGLVGDNEGTALGWAQWLRLVGLMCYEAHIAGVGDNPPGQALRAREDVRVALREDEHVEGVEAA